MKSVGKKLSKEYGGWNRQAEHDIRSARLCAVTRSSSESADFTSHVHILFLYDIIVPNSLSCFTCASFNDAMDCEFCVVSMMSRLYWDEKNQVTQRKTCPSTTLPMINPTCTGLGFNTAFRWESSATNNRATALLMKGFLSKPFM